MTRLLVGLISLLRIMKIAIDTVFFERKFSGISKVWVHILKNTQLPIVLLVRENAKLDESLLKRFETVPIRSFKYEDAMGDVSYLGAIVQKHRCDYFISTYYTYCQSVPNVCLVHDLIPELFMNMGDSMWVQKSMCYKNASHFISVSYNTHLDLKRFYGVDSYVWYPAVNLASDFKYLVKGVPYFLCLCTNSESYKNIALVRSFFEGREDLHLVCVGTPATPKCTYFANVSEKELKGLYKGALATIIPSLYEGFGLPLIESFSVGTPVICVKTPVSTEVGKKFAIFCDNSVGSLGQAVKSVLDGKIPSKNTLRTYAQLFKAGTRIADWDKIWSLYIPKQVNISCIKPVSHEWLAMYPCLKEVGISDAEIVLYESNGDPTHEISKMKTLSDKVKGRVAFILSGDQNEFVDSKSVWLVNAWPRVSDVKGCQIFVTNPAIFKMFDLGDTREIDIYFKGTVWEGMRTEMFNYFKDKPKCVIVQFNNYWNWRFGKQPTQLEIESVALEMYHELSQAKLCLCPKGKGCSSMRVVECLALGVVPVLIDDFSHPFGIDWSDYGLVFDTKKDSFEKIYDECCELIRDQKRLQNLSDKGIQLYRTIIAKDVWLKGALYNNLNTVAFGFSESVVDQLIKL